MREGIAYCRCFICSRGNKPIWRFGKALRIHKHSIAWRELGSLARSSGCMPIFIGIRYQPLNWGLDWPLKHHQHNHEAPTPVVDVQVGTTL